MGRPAVSLAVLLGLPVLVLVVAPRAALLAFAGVLLAVALRAAADGVMRVTGWPGWAAVAAVVLTGLALLAGGAALAAPALARQLDELVRQLPDAWEGLRATLEGTAWGRAVLQEVGLGGVVGNLGPDAAGIATAAAARTAGGLTDAVFLLFLGAFLAAAPWPYLAGVRALLAPALRPRWAAVARDLYRALAAWVGAQMLAMAVVGGLTYAGLALLGMPLAGILAVVAALFGFVPILGPIIAAVPALLLAIGEGWTMVAWVAALYLGVQMIEGNVITPLVQSRAINLPPGLILLAQLLMLTLFGLLGLAMAAPLAAVLLVLVHRLYVQGYLEAAAA
jgi:predicted PurR-regulated permease PerM